jgi:hypothetical protein
MESGYFPTAYEFACGSTVHKEINEFWVEIYYESNCYHVRKGKLGGKWFIWETYDNTIPNKFRAAKKKFKSLLKGE